MSITLNIPSPPRTYIHYRGGGSYTFLASNSWYQGNRNTSLMSQWNFNTLNGTGITPFNSSLVADSNGLKLPFQCKFLEARVSCKTMPSAGAFTFEWYIYANQEPDGNARGVLLNAQVLFQGSFTTPAGTDIQLDRVLTPSSFPTLPVFTKIYISVRCTNSTPTIQHPELIMIFEEVI